MVTFTQIPEHYTPLGGAVLYAFQSDAPQNVDIRFTDDANGRLLGARRFVSVTETAFDAAPMLRRAVRFTPSGGGTGLSRADGRQAMVSAELFTETSGLTADAFAPTRIYLPCHAAEAPGLLTTMPAERLIAPGECDELTLLCDRPCTVTVTVRGFGFPGDNTDGAEADGSRFGGEREGEGNPSTAYEPCNGDGACTVESAERRADGGEPRNGDNTCGYERRAEGLSVGAESPDGEIGRIAETAAADERGLSVRSYSVPTAGLYLFRLDMRDFPEAERIRIDAGPCGAVDYTVIPAPQDGVRLAWRSSAGSIEHYTFPVVRETAIDTARQDAYGPDGHTAGGAAQERRQTLVSAYERPAVLEALAELHASPQCWIARADDYIPVAVVPETAVIHRHGALSCLEVRLRPILKTRLPWN